MEDIQMTQVEYNRLCQEVEALDRRQREVSATRFAETTDLGDNGADNTEVLEARRELEIDEQRIDQLRRRMDRAVIVEPGAARGVAAIGTRVKLTEDDTAQVAEYEIVGSHQGQPDDGKLAHDSPLGEALCGHRAGDTVDIHAPTGNRQARIISVTRARRAQPAGG